MPLCIQRCSAGIKPPLERTEKARGGSTVTFRSTQTSPDTWPKEEEELNETPPAATLPAAAAAGANDKENDAKAGAKGAAMAAAIAPQHARPHTYESALPQQELSVE